MCSQLNIMWPQEGSSAQKYSRTCTPVCAMWWSHYGLMEITKTLVAFVWCCVVVVFLLQNGILNGVFVQECQRMNH